MMCAEGDAGDRFDEDLNTYNKHILNSIIEMTSIRLDDDVKRRDKSTHTESLKQMCICIMHYTHVWAKEKNAEKY